MIIYLLKKAAIQSPYPSTAIYLDQDGLMFPELIHYTA